MHHRIKSYNGLVNTQMPCTIKMFNPVIILSENDHMMGNDKYLVEVLINFENFKLGLSAQTYNQMTDRRTDGHLLTKWSPVSYQYTIMYFGRRFASIFYNEVCCETIFGLVDDDAWPSAGELQRLCENTVQYGWTSSSPPHPPRPQAFSSH